MKRFIVNTLAVFGAIFICLILAAVYLFVADPFNLKAIFSQGASPMSEAAQVEEVPEATNQDDKLPGGSDTVNEATTPSAAVPARVEFTLSAAQRQALLNLGISPDSIPTSLSYEQEQCFVNVLGQARVAEIKAGAIPGPVEFIRAKACI